MDTETNSWGGFSKTKHHKLNMSTFVQNLDNGSLVYGFDYDVKCHCP